MKELEFEIRQDRICDKHLFLLEMRWPSTTATVSAMLVIIPGLEYTDSGLVKVSVLRQPVTISPFKKYFIIDMCSTVAG